ncbi:hypothetical protein [uncultured phage cr106_1]|uniref:Uncharacterized protein n=1 Tax=uncultured phage cr106_1 TaxID=2772062 RepID=A0A7M1RVE3_9CAUD|nr:hypothetical protein KNV29_gp012 [uncultured phage cr106_1]QOR58266.1 hypothetical protein [uncultured phage cr106_1]
MAISIGIGNYIRSSLYNRTSNKSPFHPSLVDYWSFSGKSNSNADRDKIKGIKGNILNAYNFSWSLSSGYGQYLEDWRFYTYIADRAIISLKYYYLFAILESKDTSAFFMKDGGAKAYKIKVRGIKAGEGLKYVYGLDENHVVNITQNGEYELPAGDMAEFQCTFIGKCGIVLEQVQNYQGAIVTDGITSHLKLDKVGYKVRTVIIKFKPINIKPNVTNAVLNIHTDEVALQYSTSGVISSNFTTYKDYGEYSIGTFNIDKNAVTPLTLGCKLSNSDKPMEYSNVAIYDIAIYSKVLTDEEIKNEINIIEYGTPNPAFALNFDNFAYRVTDWVEFSTGKTTTNKIVVNSTTEVFNGAFAMAMNPEADTGDEGSLTVTSFNFREGPSYLRSYSAGDNVEAFTADPSRVPRDFINSYQVLFVYE